MDTQVVLVDEHAVVLLGAEPRETVVEVGRSGPQGLPSSAQQGDPGPPGPPGGSSIEGLFSVKDPNFGATGDPDDDQTVPLQDAFNAARDSRMANEYMGGVPYLPPGVFTISEQIEIVTGVLNLNDGCIGLLGAGKGASVVRWKEGVPRPESMFRLVGDGANGANGGALWAGFSLDGNGICSRGIYPSRQHFMTFDRIGFKGFVAGDPDDACIYGDETCILHTLHMCSFGEGGVNGNKGVYYNDGHVIRVTRSEVGGQAAGGIHFEGGEDNVVELTSLEGITEDGTASIIAESWGMKALYNFHEDLSSQWHPATPNSRSILVKAGIGKVQLVGNTLGIFDLDADHAIEWEGDNHDGDQHANVWMHQANVKNVKVGPNSDILCYGEVGAPALSAHILKDPSSIVRTFVTTTV